MISIKSFINSRIFTTVVRYSLKSKSNTLHVAWLVPSSTVNKDLE